MNDDQERSRAEAATRRDADGASMEELEAAAAIYDRALAGEKCDPDVEAIWNELAPWIASEDPPLTGDDEADLIALCEGPLPRVWDRVLSLDSRLAEYENDETPTRRELAHAKRAVAAHERTKRTMLNFIRAAKDDLTQAIAAAGDVVAWIREAEQTEEDEHDE